MQHHQKTLKKLSFLFAIGFLLSVPMSYGAADTIFTAVITKLTTILTGTGGIMLTLLALLVAAVSFLGHAYKTALGALAVAIIASVGPSVANSFFTAVL